MKERRQVTLLLDLMLCIQWATRWAVDSFQFHLDALVEARSLSNRLATSEATPLPLPTSRTALAFLFFTFETRPLFVIALLVVSSAGLTFRGFVYLTLRSILNCAVSKQYPATASPNSAVVAPAR
ncbi:hypothetical protein VTK73DRAFT_1771 [Phialemonium thermophilum]|uniref:Uncharacterized protein n=1 Tax=Phialemonium thermophilum TaxID=223376 RepID=A0ABR3VT32_9PEZI